MEPRDTRCCLFEDLEEGIDAAARGEARGFEDLALGAHEDQARDR